jgi:hypothetical protein
MQVASQDDVLTYVDSRMANLKQKLVNQPHLLTLLALPSFAPFIDWFTIKKVHFPNQNHHHSKCW